MTNTLAPAPQHTGTAAPRPSAHRQSPYQAQHQCLQTLSANIAHAIQWCDALQAHGGTMMGLVNARREITNAAASIERALCDLEHVSTPWMRRGYQAPAAAPDSLQEVSSCVAVVRTQATLLQDLVHAHWSVATGAGQAHGDIAELPVDPAFTEGAWTALGAWTGAMLRLDAIAFPRSAADEGELQAHGGGDDQDGEASQAPEPNQSRETVG